jgi:hypothetical protein
MILNYLLPGTYLATHFFQWPQKCPGRIRIRNSALRIRITASERKIYGSRTLLARMISCMVQRFYSHLYFQLVSMYHVWMTFNVEQVTSRLLCL